MKFSLKRPQNETLASIGGAVVALSLSVWFYAAGKNADFSKTGTWLLAANFTAAFFAINFAFVGYNLSPYSKLWRKLSALHWALFFYLLLLPLFPAICLLISPGIIWLAALVVAPWVTFLAFHAYFLTAHILDPTHVLKSEYTPETINAYRLKLANLIEEDVKRQKAERLVPIEESPMHMISYQPFVIEASTGGLWDRLLTILSVAVDIHDYTVFSAAFEKAVSIYKVMHVQVEGTDPEVLKGLQYIAQRRLQTILTIASKSSSDRVFMEAVNNRLCAELTSKESLENFGSQLTSSVLASIGSLCREALVNGKAYDAMKGLNAIHAYTSVGAKRTREHDALLAPVVLASCVDRITILGQYAVLGRNVEFLYRCLDSLTWLGCDMASRQESRSRLRDGLISAIAGLVQLGREARAAKLQCFWDKCIIPPHLHAEEKLGEILRYLVNIRDAEDFYLEDRITSAYSRLRGFRCRIEPKPNLNPAFWIKDEKDAKGEKVPCVETMHGEEGYNWTVDYSDINELKALDLY